MTPLPDGSLSSKMKAPKNAIPAKNIDSIAALQQFHQHMEHLLSLLQLVEKADLNHLRIYNFFIASYSFKNGRYDFVFYCTLKQTFFTNKEIAS